MGYKRPKFRLKFEREDMAGLEVTVRGLSVDGLLKLIRLADGLKGDGSITAKLETASQLFDAMAGSLVSWNLEDDDGPVAADRDGIAAQDLGFLLGIVYPWIEAVASVDTPLPQGSASGQPSAAESTLGLAESSQSLPS
jgi:hypothetical protein